jgi:hypothetical protein
MRPHFQILDWIRPGGDSDDGGDLPHKPSPQIAGPAGDGNAPAVAPSKLAKPSKKKTSVTAGLKTVSEPSLAEEMDDQIPF